MLKYILYFKIILPFVVLFTGVFHVDITTYICNAATLNAILQKNTVKITCVKISCT